MVAGVGGEGGCHRTVGNVSLKGYKRESEPKGAMRQTYFKAATQNRRTGEGWHSQPHVNAGRLSCGVGGERKGGLPKDGTGL